MRIHATLLLRACAVLLVLATAACAKRTAFSEQTGDGTDRLVVAPGDVVRYRITVDQRDNRVLFGNDNVVETTQTFETTWTAQRRNTDGSIRVVLHVDAVRFDRVMPRDAVSYDSSTDGPPQTLLGRAFAALVGRSLVLDIAPDRRLVGLGGDEEWLDAMLDAIGGDQGALQPHADTIKEFHSREALLGLLAMVLPPSPDPPDAETWVVRRTLPSSYFVVAEEALAVREPVDRFRHVHVGGFVVSDFSIKKGTVREQKVNYELLGELEGYYLIEPESGWVEEGKLDVTARGELVFVEPIERFEFPSAPTTLNLLVVVERLRP
ncbi:MAG: hypothetical protein KF858_04285 [Candidatus Sumerlaeia bacterium]|nr:hypothetical protein [Candidatus Sumerlaeia bacterium]